LFDTKRLSIINIIATILMILVRCSHEKSSEFCLINSTKQVNKVKPNVNRATNDSLSSPNQPYNQRYLIIRSALQFHHHLTYTRPNMITYIAIVYKKTYLHPWSLEYSITRLFCTQPRQHMRISLLRINSRKARSDHPKTTLGFLISFFFMSSYGETYGALDIWYRHVFSKQWKSLSSLSRLNVNIFLKYVWSLSVLSYKRY